MRYSPSEWIKNCYSLVLTKMFFPSARLIRRPFYLRGYKKGMTYGKGFTTGYRCRFEIFAPKGKISLTIGDNCKIGDQVHIAASSSVSIGHDCLMASNVYISDTNHGNGLDSPDTVPDQRELSFAPVSIGDRVWLGEGVAVLPGSVIGSGAVIGAHAVVKGEIPPNTVAVGAPARPVKRYNSVTNTWEKI